jgi:hypothetical protein
MAVSRASGLEVDSGMYPGVLVTQLRGWAMGHPSEQGRRGQGWKWGRLEHWSGRPSLCLHFKLPNLGWLVP